MKVSPGYFDAADLGTEGWALYGRTIDGDSILFSEGVERYGVRWPGVRTCSVGFRGRVGSGPIHIGMDLRDLVAVWHD